MLWDIVLQADVLAGGDILIGNDIATSRDSFSWDRFSRDLLLLDAKESLEPVQLDQASLGVELEILVHLGLQIDKDILVELVEGVDISSLLGEQLERVEADILLGVLYEHVERSVAVEVLLVGISSAIEKELHQFILVVVLANQMKAILAIAIHNVQSSTASNEGLNEVQIWHVLLIIASNVESSSIVLINIVHVGSSFDEFSDFVVISLEEARVVFLHFLSELIGEF
jgi:hypothetical protein